MVLIRGLVASFYSFRIVHGRKMCMAEERSKKLELLWYVPSERSGNRNKLKKRFVSISTASCFTKAPNETDQLSNKNKMPRSTVVYLIILPEL